MRNRQLVVLWLIDNAPGAIEVRKRDGKTYYVVTSVGSFREGCGRLLAEIMRIKATGDFKAGKALVETYGTKVDRQLHAEVLDRIAGLNLPSVTGFVQPELRLVTGADGEPVDVEVVHCQNLADQMLRCEAVTVLGKLASRDSTTDYVLRKLARSKSKGLAARAKAALR